jgi:hypothetical protein
MLTNQVDTVKIHDSTNKVVRFNIKLTKIIVSTQLTYKIQ